MLMRISCSTSCPSGANAFYDLCGDILPDVILVLGCYFYEEQSHAWAAMWSLAESMAVHDLCLGGHGLVGQRAHGIFSRVRPSFSHGSIESPR